MRDPIVDEVRATRARIAQECGFDLRRILDHARDAAGRLTGLRYVTADELHARRARNGQETRSVDIPQEPFMVILKPGDYGISGREGSR